MAVKKRTLYEHNGEIGSIRYWAKQSGVSYQHLCAKIASGMTMDEALASIVPKKEAKKVIYKGREYTITQLATLCGLSRGMLSQRIFHLGWDVERAISKPKRGNAQYVAPIMDRAGCRRYDCVHQDGSGKCHLGIKKDRDSCENYYDAFEYYYGNDVKWKKGQNDPWAEERKRLIG